jgi:replicative DNA helicase
MSIESKAVQYFESKGWMETAKFSDDHVMLELCPICGKDGWHFYVNISPEKDGLYSCKVGGCEGNLTKLRQELGDTQQKTEAHTELTSTSDWAKDKKPDVLPNVAACYSRLINDVDALDYLMNTRGWSRRVIDELQLGLMAQHGKKYLVIPYLDQTGQIVFSKYRSLPPAEKAFFISKGHPTRLYNETCIQPEMEELTLLEGEGDTITMLDWGITSVVGVPGAGNKKTEWITKIDKARPKKIYILFDNDKAGQQGAAELAKKLMLNTELPTPLSIVLPPFETHDGDEGKDISDFKRAGHTREEFEALKEKALPFEVKGVATLGDALDRLEQELLGKELLAPRYATQFASLNTKLGGFERGDIVDIIAGEKQGKSSFALNLIEHLVSTYNESGLFECLEMPDTRLARKWVSMVTKTDDSPAKTPEEARARMLVMREAIVTAKQIAGSREADLLFGFTRVKDPEEIYDTIRQAVRRYGVRFVVVDNIQLLADQTLKNQNHRTTHLSQISKKLKALALELEIVMFRIVQPNRIREGEVASHLNADGSSQLAKDCDATIALHRNTKMKLSADDLKQIGFMDEDQSFEPQLYTRVSITRYAAGGMCTLKFQGEYSLVSEWTSDEAAGLTNPVQAGLDMKTIAVPVGGY